MVLPLLASLGLPLLLSLARGGLSRLGHPAADAAAGALAEAQGAIDAGEIPPERVAEAARHVEEMARIEAERDGRALAEVNATMRAEAASEDAWARRWRPFFGYCVATSWLLLMLSLCWVVVREPDKAAATIAAVAETGLMWSIALAVLGVQVVKRTDEKLAQMGADPRHGLAARLASALSPGSGKQ